MNTLQLDATALYLIKWHRDNQIDKSVAVQLFQKYQETLIWPINTEPLPLIRTRGEYETYVLGKKLENFEIFVYRFFLEGALSWNQYELLLRLYEQKKIIESMYMICTEPCVL